MKKLVILLIVLTLLCLSSCSLQRNSTTDASNTAANSSATTSTVNSQISTSNTSTTSSSQINSSSKPIITSKPTTTISSNSSTSPIIKPLSVILGGLDGYLHIGNMIYDGSYRYTLDLKTKQPFQMVPKANGFSPFGVCKIGDRFYFNFSANTYQASFHLGSCDSQGGGFKDLGETSAYGFNYANGYFYTIKRVSETDNDSYFLMRRNIDGTNVKTVGQISIDGKSKNSQIYFKISDGYAFFVVNCKKDTSYTTQILRISLVDAKTTVVKAFNADDTTRFSTRSQFVLYNGFVYLIDNKQVLKIKCDGSSTQLLYTYTASPRLISWILSDKLYVSTPGKIMSITLDGKVAKDLYRYGDESDFMYLQYTDDTWIYMYNIKGTIDHPNPHYRVKKDGSKSEPL